MMFICEDPLTRPPLASKQELVVDVTQPVEGVVTLHVLRGGGECGAAGVLVDFPGSHDWELSCKHPQSAWGKTANRSSTGDHVTGGAYQPHRAPGPPPRCHQKW